MVHRFKVQPNLKYPMGFHFPSFSILNFLFYFMHVGIVLVYMSVSCECLVPMEARGGFWTLWFRNYGQSPCGCWALTPGPLQGQTIDCWVIFPPSLPKYTSKRHALLFSPISRSLTYKKVFHTHENVWQTSVPNHIHKDHRERRCLRWNFSFCLPSNQSVGRSPKFSWCSECLHQCRI